MLTTTTLTDVFSTLIEFDQTETEANIHYRIESLSDSFEGRMSAAYYLREETSKIDKQIAGLYLAAGLYPNILGKYSGSEIELLGFSITLNSEIQSKDIERTLFADYRLSLKRREPWASPPGCLGKLIYDALKAQMPC